MFNLDNLDTKELTEFLDHVETLKLYATYRRLYLTYWSLGVHDVAEQYLTVLPDLYNALPDWAKWKTV